MMIFLALIGLFALYTLWIVRERGEILFIEIQVVNLKFATVSFVMIADLIRMAFILSVSIIRIAVLKFRESYISRDPYFLRFHFLLMSFIFRIYFLILRPNFIRLLLGWDGLGLRSYLLVIYYGNTKAYNSGIITAITNRLGDALILISIAYIYKTGTWHIFLYSLEPIYSSVTVLIMIAATTKRAQIPFSAWLPAAIAAPTPVSSLVHSSTLVTAGVYLLIRHNLLFLQAQTSYYLIVMGTLTILIARVRALFEIDLKKIVALSTLRQLGVIILRLGLGAFVARFFHLLTHAFFKALLFLATGSVIHRRNRYQDLRTIGRLRKIIPLTRGFILLSLLSLIGLPFMSAFFSKELILEIILIKNFNAAIYGFIALGVRLTALYRARFVYIGIVNFRKNEQTIFKSDEDTPLIIRISILMAPAIIAGAYLALALFPSTILRSRPSLLKVRIILLVLSRLLFRVYFNSKLILTSWNKAFWTRGLIWSLPQIRPTTPIILTSLPGTSINKLLDRGIFLSIIKLTEAKILKTRLLAHTLRSLQKILSIRVLWGILGGLYYLCNELQNLIKKITLNPKFIISKSKKQPVLSAVSLKKENFSTKKVNNRKMIFI